LVQLVVRGIEYYSGTPGLPSAQYKLYLTDIKMAAGQSFTAVQSIGYNGGGSTVYGKADIFGSNGLNANTSDPLFDRAVFRLPAQAIKRLRTTSGTIQKRLFVLCVEQCVVYDRRNSYIIHY